MEKGTVLCFGFLLIFHGMCLAQEMRVTGNSNEINCGDVTPSTTDYTSFGAVDVDGGTVDRTYYIYNDGGGDLNLSGSPRVAILGGDASDFSVTSQPPSPLSSGRSGYFTIRFNPSLNGLREATVSIANNDADENPYTFAISGSGLGGSYSEMSVWGNSVEIIDEDNSPGEADWTDFGNVGVAYGSKTREFTIKNTGNIDLTLDNSPCVVLMGANYEDFSVDVQPSGSIAPSGSTTFRVTFNPSVQGERSAEIFIDNNDPDEDPYNFAITGTGALPDIDVSGNGVSISNGDDTPDPADKTDYGRVEETGTAYKRQTYALDNTVDNSVDLILDGSPKVAISGTHASDFTVIDQPVSPVVYRTPTSFRIIFDPTGFGTRTAQVSISSNDLDENPFTYSIVGIGVAPSAPEIAVGARGEEILNGDSTPSADDSTDFGAVNAGNSTAVRFYLYNQGTAGLTLDGSPLVAITGADAADFQVTSDPASSVAADFDSTAFVIMFSPQDGGEKSATVSISNDDSDENPYTFAIQGTCTSPEMDVTGNGNEVECGSTTPSESNDTDFGNVTVGDSGAKTYTISNSGTEDLIFDGDPRVALSGDHAGDFSVTLVPNTPVVAGGSTLMQVTFTPSAAGERTATLSMDNNDSNEAPYTFVLKGTGEASLPVELHSLSAEPASGGVRVAWSTESETGNLGFILEKASGTPSPVWDVIASYETDVALAGCGTSSERHDYAFLDAEVDAGQHYVYRLSHVNTLGEIRVYDEIAITLPGAPGETALLPPVPNPFNPQTKVSYQLAERGPVEIAVFDLLGRKVRILVDEEQAAGSYHVYWHGNDASGLKTASGTYLIVLTTPEGVKTQKAVMLR